MVAATKDLVLAARKAQPDQHLLDLETHLNQYLRSFLPPPVPQVKLEPSALCDVALGEKSDEEGGFTKSLHGLVY